MSAPREHEHAGEQVDEQLRAAREVVAVLKRRVIQAEEGIAASRFALHKALAGLENTVVERSRALVESEARYRALFEHSPNMQLIIDAQRRIVAANHTCCESLGQPLSMLLGQPLAELFDERCAPRIAALSADASEQELTLLNDCTVVVTAASLPGEDRGLLVSLRDVTARLELTRKLEHAQRLAAIGRLAAGVAHEINNPLAVLQLGLEHVLATMGVDGGMRQRLEQLVDHADRIARIVESLNDFARPRSPLRERLPVLSLLRSAAEVAQKPLHAASLVLDVQPDDLELWGDRGQIEQVLVNLLSNAGRAVGNGGEVRIEARADGSRGLVRVLDDGPGVEPQLLPHLFSPFVTGAGGMGLGLSISWGLVQENGGTLRVENRASGGACFELALALPQSPSQSPDPDTQPSHGLRVLCVEDEPVLLNLLLTMLRELGHTPVPARSAEEALQRLEQETVDALLTDVQLPGMSGDQLSDLVNRKHPALRDRTVLMSGMFHAVPPGQRWLQKPFSFDDLTRALDALPR
jgi:PAS domain S-box-containing protein